MSTLRDTVLRLLRLLTTMAAILLITTAAHSQTFRVDATGTIDQVYDPDHLLDATIHTGATVKLSFKFFRSLYSPGPAMVGEPYGMSSPEYGWTIQIGDSSWTPGIGVNDHASVTILDDLSSSGRYTDLTQEGLIRHTSHKTSSAMPTARAELQLSPDLLELPQPIQIPDPSAFRTANFTTMQFNADLSGAEIVATIHVLNARWVSGPKPDINPILSQRFPISNQLIRRYKLTDIGLFPNGTFTHANAINDSSQVVGQADVGATFGMGSDEARLLNITPAFTFDNPAFASGPSHGNLSTVRFSNPQAFIWQNGVKSLLGTPQTLPWSSAVAVNDHGEVIVETVAPLNIRGYSAKSRNMIWNQGKLTELPASLPVFGRDIISANDTILSGGTGFYKDGRFTPLGTLKSRSITVYSADCISSDGDIAGTAHPPYNNGADLRLIYWNNGKAHDLGYPVAQGAWTEAINDKEQIIGTINAISGVNIGFLCNHGRLYDIDPPGYRWATDPTSGDEYEAIVNAINNASQIVGQINDDSYLSPQQPPFAALWERGKWYDLNALTLQHPGWELTTAMAINNKGQIVGEGMFQGKEHAFLLTPVDL